MADGELRVGGYDAELALRSESPLAQGVHAVIEHYHLCLLAKTYMDS